MKPLLIIGGGGAILYYLYSKGYFGGHSGPTVTSTPSTGTSPTPTGTGTGTSTTTAPNPNSPASIYTRLVANAQAPTAGLTPYQWNYSLKIVAPSITPPDPQVVWPSGTDLTVPMSASQYWGVMAPYLSASLGMSGFGLGALIPVGWN